MGENGEFRLEQPAAGMYLCPFKFPETLSYQDRLGLHCNAIPSTMSLDLERSKRHSARSLSP